MAAASVTVQLQVRLKSKRHMKRYALPYAFNINSVKPYHVSRSGREHLVKVEGSRWRQRRQRRRAQRRRARRPSRGVKARSPRRRGRR